MNQTLTEIVRDAVQMSIKPDYFGWTIGILGIITGLVAIVITILIYKKQAKLAIQIDTLRKDKEKRSAGLLLMAIHGSLLDLEHMELLEEEAREKGLIPISMKSLEEIKQNNDKQKFSELREFEERCIGIEVRVKKNIEEIEKILSLVYDNLDNNVVYKLTLLLQSLKRWEWQSSIYESEPLLYIVINPSASSFCSRLKEINDELEKIRGKLM